MVLAVVVLGQMVVEELRQLDKVIMVVVVTLRAIYSRRLDGDDYLTAVAGDGLYYIFRWMPSGEQRLLGTHQYGNDMTNADSPHYLDQAEDYANEVLHEPLYTKESRQGRIERRYTVSSKL